ncbi:MFS transporter [Streptomyces sp. NPDC001617]
MTAVVRRRARASVSAIFFVHGGVFASWAARIPAVEGGLRLPPGLLGLVLAGPGLGALAGSRLGGLLVRRLGSRAVSGLAPVWLSVPLGLVPTAHTAAPLAGLLVLLGAADGCTSVAMNAQAVVVQRHYGRAVLNSMHAIRSIGAVTGGLAAVAMTALGLSSTPQSVSVAAVLAAISAGAACGLEPDEPPPAEHGNDAHEPPPAERVEDVDEPSPVKHGEDGVPRTDAHRATVLTLMLMTFLAALVEDAPASWSGVYLRHMGADSATAAAGYAAFSAGSVASRLVNDRLVDRIGWTRLIRAGTLACAAALGVALLLGRPVITLAALVVAGAGISAVFPGAFTAAGTLPGSALVMGQVGFAGNLGWLLVSPIIGGVAALVGLPTALGLLVGAAVSIAALAPVTGRPSDCARPTHRRAGPDGRARPPRRG